MTLRCMALIILLVAFQENMQGQHQTNVDTLLSGRKALVFSFSGFNLGGGLGGKYWLDDSYNIRLMLTGTYRSSTDNKPLLYSSSYNYNSSSSQIGTDIGVARKFVASRVLFPFAGVAAHIDQTWNKIERVYISRTETEKFTTWGFGGSLFVGVEYWFTKDISLSGEQAISLSYLKQADYKSFSLGNSTSSLLLSVYF